MALTKLNTYSLADDAITSAKIADNAVVTAAIADDAVTSAKTTVSAPNPNLIINGDMSIAQRGTSSTVSGIKTVDRWNALWSGGGITQSQVALTSGGAYDEGHRHAFKMAVTSTNSGNARYAQMRYIPEAKDIRNFGWQYTSSSSYITVSFWAKSSLAGTYFFSFYGPDSGTPQTYSTSFTLAADTWTKVTKTIPGGSNVVLNDDTGVGFYLDWRIDIGTDYTASDATMNAWHNHVSTKYTTDIAQSWQNTGSATFEVTGVKLEIGQSATTFEKPDYTTELKKCFRYYEKQTFVAGFSICGGATSNNSNGAYFDLYYEEKRANPSFVFPTASVTGNGVVPLTAPGGYPSDSTGALAANYISKIACRIDATSFGGLTGSGGNSWLYWVAENSIEISAEL